MSTLEYAETPGGRLAYTRRGTGDPLLLVMGVAGHHLMWHEAFLTRLALSYDVVAYDQRGIGSSAHASEQFTLADLRDDALAVLDHLGWDSAHVMGISMGGTIAQEMALAAPSRVRTLTLGCTWAGPGEVWGPALGQLAEAAASGDAGMAARMMFAANVSAGFAGPPGHLVEFARTAGEVKVPGPVVMMQMTAAAPHDRLADLASLDVPTLVLHGDEDAIILPAAGARLAALIPGARHEVLAGVGHLFFWEQPEHSADLVASHARG